MTYSRLERLHFFIFRRWPDRVVERRLAERYTYTPIDMSVEIRRREEYNKFFGEPK